MDPIYALLDHAESLRADRLTPSLVETTKHFILDTLAVMIAGKGSAGCAEILGYVTQWQGEPAAILITGGRVPAPYAALANSMMAHAVEFDDTYEPADVHAYAVVLPAVLAAAECAAERRIGGTEIIAATALGVDVAYRLGAALRRYRGWHPTATCGIFGATLAAGRIAGLDRVRLHHAMGIAYSLAAGNFQAVVDASLTKRLQPGFAARGALEAVLLARAGITGARDIFAGTFGFYPLYEAGEYDIAALTDGLGRSFRGEYASMKPYPCCRFCHAAIDGALQIAADGDLAPENIASVEVEIPAETYSYVGGDFRPGDKPQVNAQFSIAYTVATALLHRRVGLDHFTAEAICDPRVLALAKLIRTVPIEGTGRYGGSTIRICLKSGPIRERRVAVMKGEPKNTMSEAERHAKVKACIAFGGWPERAALELASWTRELDAQASALATLHSIIRKGAGS